MKKLVLFSLLFAGITAMNAQSWHGHKQPTPDQLVGFDHKEAMKLAKQRFSKPSEQEEHYFYLQRKYVAGKNKQVSPKYNEATHNVKGGNPSFTPQSAYCPNVGFELGNFSNWVGSTDENTTFTDWPLYTYSWTAGVMTQGNNNPMQSSNTSGAFSPYPNRHTIMTVPPGTNAPPFTCIGWDSIAIDQTSHLSEIEFVPSFANGATMRLGNSNWNAETEKISYSINVTSNNTFFTYAFAVIMQDPGHGVGQQPFFKIEARDQAGNLLSGCGIYQVDATVVATTPGFEQAAVWDQWSNSWSTSTWDVIYYKPWELVALDLTAYIGQTVTITFQTGDCTAGGHWGYAYIDANCEPATNATQLSFCGGTSAVLQGPAGYTSYQWQGPNNTVNIPGATNQSLTISNPVIGNVYTVVCGTISGCTAIYKDTIQTTQVEITNMSFTPSCPGGSSGSVTVGATGSNNPYNYVWTGPTGPVGTNSPTLSGVPPGTYTVTVSSPGCGQDDSSATVTIAPPVLMTSVQQFCTNPAIVTAPAGTNYQWYGTNNLPIGAGQGGNANPLNVSNPVSGSTYAVTYMNPNGCADSNRITISQTVNVSSQSLTYCGNAAVVTAPAGATNVVIWDQWNWPYSIIGTGSPFTINNPQGSGWGWPYYSMTYTNPTTGCKDSVTLSFTQIQGNIAVSNLSNSCESPNNTGSANLALNTASVGPYTWNITSTNGFTNTVPNTAATTQTLTNLAPGVYTALVTNAQCSFNTTFTVDTITVPVSVAIGPNCLNPGDTATVTFTYGFGATATGCGTTTVNCGAPNIIQVGSGTNNNSQWDWPCPYGNWYSNEKYQILYTAADLQAMGITAGKISSIGFDVNSIPAGMNTTFINYSIKMACTSTTDLGAGSWGSPFVVAPFTQVWGPQTYTINTGWNTHNFTSAYEWDGTSSLIVEICYDWVSSGNFTDNAVMNNVSTGYYSFSVFNSDGTVACPNTTLNQTYMERPNTRFGFCQSQVLPTDFTYNWNPNQNILGNPNPVVGDTIIEIQPPVTTPYTLTITSNTGGCSIDTTFTLTVVNPFVLAVSAPDTNMCNNGTPVTLTATASDPVTGAPMTVSGAWTGLGTSNQTNGIGTFDPSVSGTGTHILVYTATGAACTGTATLSDSITMVVNPYITAGFNSAGPFCAYDAPTTLSTLATNPGGTWYINGVASSVFNPSSLGASTGQGHAVEYVIDQGFGCPDSSTLYFVVNPAPVVSFVADTLGGCMPSLPVSFTSTTTIPGGTYAWSFGDASTSGLQNPVHVYNQAGVFTVYLNYIAPSGCSDDTTANQYITLNNSPIPDFVTTPEDVTTLAPYVDFVNITPNSGGLVWDWDIAGMDSSSQFNTSFTFPSYGTYYVSLSAIDANGCTGSVTHPVEIEADHAIYIPGGFSPNGDGKNDVFMAYGDGLNTEEGFKMMIFNRWGEKVFETDNINEGWKGSKNNVNDIYQEPEVFIYKITYKDLLGKSRTKTGHVTVVR